MVFGNWKKMTSMIGSMSKEIQIVMEHCNLYSVLHEEDKDIEFYELESDTLPLIARVVRDHDKGVIEVTWYRYQEEEHYKEIAKDGR